MKYKIHLENNDGELEYFKTVKTMRTVNKYCTCINDNGIRVNNNYSHFAECFDNGKSVE
jgi:hypothetical protein